ncbi:LuxR C-terminal-related transcriptional regulator, partial [Rhizobium ruizarguesonis]
TSVRRCHPKMSASVSSIAVAAAELGISEVTLQIHRRNVMKKMAAASLADLVRIAERLEIPINHSRRVGGN